MLWLKDFALFLMDIRNNIFDMCRLFFTIFLLAVGMGLRAQQQAVVVIDGLPAGMSADSVYLAAAINRWNPCCAAHRFVIGGDGRLVLVLSDAPDTVRFRVCRGSWRAVECLPNGMDSPMHIAIGGDTTHISVDAWRDAVPVKQLATTAGKNVRFAPQQLDMPQLGKHRSVRVYFPPNYFNGKAFPVIYMYDAQNLFDNATSTTRSEWRVDEIMDALYYSRGFAAIVVGLNAATRPHERSQELTPWDNDSLSIAGRGDAFAKFVVKTLKPFIDGHYRSDPRRERTAIIGAELAGLSAFYIAQQSPEVFGMAAAIGPLIEPCPKAIDFRAKLKPNKRSQRFYLSIGEEQPQRNVVEGLYAQMQAAGFVDVGLNICPYGQDAEWYYGEEFDRAVRFLFGLRE